MLQTIFDQFPMRPPLLQCGHFRKLVMKDDQQEVVHKNNVAYFGEFFSSISKPASLFMFSMTDSYFLKHFYVR